MIEVDGITHQMIKEMATKAGMTMRARLMKVAYEEKAKEYGLESMGEVVAVNFAAVDPLLVGRFEVVNDPSPVDSETWGRIKSFYR